MHAGAFSLPDHQGWSQAGSLAVALVLTSLIGLEREVRHKAAGLRTHALVGLGAALFVLVGKYGFADLAGVRGYTVGPDRIAAQVVTGIGFIGGGLIFVKKDDVRGLTTAATIWLAAAVGMACGASLPWIATMATGAYFVVALGYAPVSRRLPRSRHAPSRLHLTYRDGVGALRGVLVVCSAQDFRVGSVDVLRERPEAVEVVLEVIGHHPVADLVAAVSEVHGVVQASAGDANEPVE